MRIVKAVTLALTAITLFTAGCASERVTDEESSPTAPAAEPKQAKAAELPSEGDDAKGAPPAEGETSLAPATVDEPVDEGTDADDGDDATPAPPSIAPPPPPKSEPGPKPTNTCSVSKDSNGFFTRHSGKSDYVAFVPPTYSSSKPMRLIVGLHGCSDNAANFAKWGVNPWDARSTQQHIGISVGGESGNNKCWKMGVDDEKVMAAVEDIAKCFWIDRSKVVIAGYSSGGQLAYRVGLKQADKFAGILIENSGLYAAGDTPANLTKNASWKINVAHSASTGDSVFPVAKVEADWAVLKAAGFPLKSQKKAGPHNGDGKTWLSWLIPASAGWVKPAR